MDFVKKETGEFSKSIFNIDNLNENCTKIKNEVNANGEILCEINVKGENVSIKDEISNDEIEEDPLKIKQLSDNESFNKEDSNSGSESDYEADNSFEIRCQRNSHVVHACPYPKCTKTFSRPWRLKTHICTHTGEKPFKCNIEGCNKSYIRNSHLQRHIENSHTITNNQIPEAMPCPQCDKSYANIHSLKKHLKNRHEKSHSNKSKEKAEKVIKCDLCHEQFNDKLKLKCHLVSVHEEEKFKCNYCPKTFNSEGSLKNHKRNVHYEIKNHKCELCPTRSFRSAFRLKSHIKVVHDGIKEHECNFCGRHFGDKVNLMSHIRNIHEKQKNFQCVLCQKAFSSSSNLRH